MASILVPLLIFCVTCTNVKAEERPNGKGRQNKRSPSIVFACCQDDPVVLSILETVKNTVLEDPCYKTFMTWPSDYKTAGKKCDAAVKALTSLPPEYKDPKCSSVKSVGCCKQPGGMKCTVNPYTLVKSKSLRKVVPKVDKDWMYQLDSCIEKSLLRKWRPPMPRRAPPPPESKQDGNPEEDYTAEDEENLLTVRKMVLNDSCIGMKLQRPTKVSAADKQCEDAAQALMELPIEDSDPKCEFVTSGRCRNTPEGKRCTVHPYKKAGFPCRDSKTVDSKTTYTLESCVEATLLKWWKETHRFPPSPPSSPKANGKDVLMERRISRNYDITERSVANDSDS